MFVLLGGGFIVLPGSTISAVNMLTVPIKPCTSTSGEVIAVKRQLTVTVSESIYEALYRQVGKGQITKFIQNVVSANLDLTDESLEAGYRAMMADTEQDKKAEEWLSNERGECLPTYSEGGRLNFHLLETARRRKRQSL